MYVCPLQVLSPLHRHKYKFYLEQEDKFHGKVQTRMDFGPEQKHMVS